jgi:hypothetical protein
MQFLKVGLIHKSTFRFQLLVKVVKILFEWHRNQAALSYPVVYCLFSFTIVLFC